MKAQEALIGPALRYLVAGVCTSLLDLGLFSLLAVVLHVQPVIANIVSTTITVCVSYFINQHLVFRSKKRGFRSFLSFAGLTLFTGLVLQSLVITGVIWGLTAFAPALSQPIVLASSKVVAMGIGAVANFLGYRFIFTR